MILDSYAEIGAVLRQARLDARLTLREAASRVHIRAHYLEALEQGHMHQLPGLPYVRGFLRAYSVFLELDKEEIMRRFEQVEGGLRKQHLTLPEVFSKEKSPSHEIVWGALAACLGLYLAWAIFIKPPSSAVDVAIVAPPPPLEQKELKPLDEACFKASKQLYPPCYAAKRSAGLIDSLYPHRSQKTSVMELANQ